MYQSLFLLRFPFLRFTWKGQGVATRFVIKRGWVEEKKNARNLYFAKWTVTLPIKTSLYGPCRAGRKKSSYLTSIDSIVTNLKTWCPTFKQCNKAALTASMSQCIVLNFAMLTSNQCTRHCIVRARKRGFREIQKQKMIEQKGTEPAQTEWGAPIVFVQTNDGSIRFFVHYRQLNDLTNDLRTPYCAWTKMLFN